MACKGLEAIQSDVAEPKGVAAGFTFHILT
jgi:hypothetical protein